MRKVYIVLTYTGTILSKIVKLYTRKEFSHVSIALDENLDEMYSFGRIHPYNPFWGGFIHENRNKGTFKRFKKTKSRIYSMQVNEEQYEEVKRVIKDINDKNKVKSYKFNVIGLITVMFNYHLKRERCFYCAEFVKYCLEESKIVTDLPEVIKPDDFNKLESSDIEEVFRGLLRDYQG